MLAANTLSFIAGFFLLAFIIKPLDFNSLMSDLLASKDINSFVAGELNEFYLSDTSVIDTTGITSLCTRSSYDVFDIPSPEFNSYLRYRLDGNYLEVTYWS